MHLPSNFSFSVTPEVPGKSIDLALLQNDKWLMNTTVCYWLYERKSQWHLTMIYIAIGNPLKFICRKIDTYNSEKKAVIFAKILQRGIQKDARGTFKINRNAFNFCNN